MDNKYKNKYLKYKNKYLQLKNLSGGSNINDNFDTILNNVSSKLYKLYTELYPENYNYICDNNCEDLFCLIIFWLFNGNINDYIGDYKKYQFDIYKDMYIIDYMNICSIIAESNNNTADIIYNFLKTKLINGDYIVISYKNGCTHIDNLLAKENNFLRPYLDKFLFIYNYTLPDSVPSNIDDFIFWIFVIYFYTIYDKNLQNLYILTNDTQKINKNNKIIYNQNNINDTLTDLIIYLQNGILSINYTYLNLFNSLYYFLRTNSELSTPFLMLIKKIQYNTYYDEDGSIDKTTILNIFANPSNKYYKTYIDNKIV
jgi:hypothetical protein